MFQRVDKDAATAPDTHPVPEKEHKKGQLTDTMHSFPTGLLPPLTKMPKISSRDNRMYFPTEGFFEDHRKPFSSNYTKQTLLQVLVIHRY